MPRFCQTCGKPLAQPASPSPATADEQPRFVIRVPGQALWEVPLSKPIVTVGRTEDNDIILSPQYVSGHHSQIEQRGTVWHYTDLAVPMALSSMVSTYGTQICATVISYASAIPRATRSA